MGGGAGEGGGGRDRDGETQKKTTCMLMDRYWSVQSGGTCAKR